MIQKHVNLSIYMSYIPLCRRMFVCARVYMHACMHVPYAKDVCVYLCAYQCAHVYVRVVRT